MTYKEYIKAIDKIATMTEEINELRATCLQYIIDHNDTVDTFTTTPNGNKCSYVSGCVVTSIDTEQLKQFWKQHTREPLPTKESFRKETIKITSKKK